jgi:hypothetical protein
MVGRAIDFWKRRIKHFIERREKGAIALALRSNLAW